MGSFNIGRALSGARSIFGQYAVQLWTLLLVIGLAAFAARQRDELGALGDALANAGPGWLVALVGLQLLAMGCSVTTYRVVLNRLGHRLDHPGLMLLHLQRHVAGTLTPIGGPASAYVFVRGLARRDVPAEDSLLALGVRGISGYAAFMTLLVPGLIITRPTPFVLGAAGMLAFVLVVLVVGAMTLLRGDRQDSHPPDWLPGKAGEFITHARAHNLRPRDLVAPYLVALLFNLTGVAMLFTSLRALGQDVSLAMALGAFAAGNLFAIIAPVFQGAGVVEVSMAVTLQSFGVSGAAALGATLLFRLADVWLPLGLGLLAQAGQYQTVRRTSLHLGGLVAGTGVVLVGWLLLPVETRMPTTQAALLAAMAGLAGMVLVYKPWRSQPAVRYTTAGAALGVVPAVVIGELDRLAVMSSDLISWVAAITF